MASESNKQTPPGDEAWWAELNQLADRALGNESLCRRIHPFIAHWFLGAMHEDPMFEPENRDEFLKRYEAIRKNPNFRSLPFNTNEGQKKRNLFLLLAGRGTFVLDLVEISHDDPEIRQALECLSQEIVNALVQNFDEDDGDTLGNLAQRIFGAEHARQPLGVMLLGVLFQISLEAGEFDDM